MTKNQNDIFSTKGFLLGVAIFLLGIVLMTARVVIDLNELKKEKQQQEFSTEKKISDRIVSLQTKLDEKLKEQVIIKKDFESTEEVQKISIFEHNPILNEKGLITAIEFIDFNDIECLKDASFVNAMFSYNENIRLISKLANISENKNLHLGNLAGLVAAEKGKFFTFREKLLLNQKTNLDSIISDLDKSEVTLRDFRKILDDNSATILRKLSQDIYQAQTLKVKNYTIIINGIVFSEAESSKYKLKDIPTYLEKFEAKF